jgi:hypothetical protein
MKVFSRIFVIVYALLAARMGALWAAGCMTLGVLGLCGGLVFLITRLV